MLRPRYNPDLYSQEYVKDMVELCIPSSKVNDIVPWCGNAASFAYQAGVLYFGFILLPSNQYLSIVSPDGNQLGNINMTALDAELSPFSNPFNTGYILFSGVVSPFDVTMYTPFTGWKIQLDSLTGLPDEGTVPNVPQIFGYKFYMLPANPSSNKLQMYFLVETNAESIDVWNFDEYETLLSDLVIGDKTFKLMLIDEDVAEYSNILDFLKLRLKYNNSDASSVIDYPIPTGYYPVKLLQALEPTSFQVNVLEECYLSMLKVSDDTLLVNNIHLMPGNQIITSVDYGGTPPSVYFRVRPVLNGTIITGDGIIEYLV